MIHLEVSYAQFFEDIFICKAGYIRIEQKFHYHSDRAHAGLRLLCSNETVDIVKYHHHYDKAREVSETSKSLLLFYQSGRRSPKHLGGCNESSDSSGASKGRNRRVSVFFTLVIQMCVY